MKTKWNTQIARKNLECCFEKNDLFYSENIVSNFSNKKPVEFFILWPYGKQRVYIKPINTFKKMGTITSSVDLG